MNGLPDDENRQIMEKIMKTLGVENGVLFVYMLQTVIRIIAQTVFEVKALSSEFLIRF